MKIRNEKVDICSIDVQEAKAVSKYRIEGQVDVRPVKIRDTVLRD